MKPISCLVVDDEPHARRLLQQQIAQCPEFRWLGEADRKASAQVAIDAVRPEVVFLDIGLPDGDGMDLARTPGAYSPLWVFVTAYEQRALDAFEVEACDFLTKPVKTERFRKALRRIQARLRPEIGTPIPVIPPSDPTPARLLEPPSHVFVRGGLTGSFVPLEDILWIQAARNETRVRLVGGQDLLVRQTMVEWLRSLPNTTFLQVDRSFLVHTRRIRHVQVGSRGAKVTFDGEPELLVLGRPAASRLRASLKLLGVNGE
jgi:DNA-binding LytR/AlgR family response regulator